MLTMAIPDMKMFMTTLGFNLFVRLKHRWFRRKMSEVIGSV